jgi:hypothetical protein
VVPAPGTYRFGIGLRGTGDMQACASLEIEPGRQRVGWRDSEAPSLEEGELSAIYEVDGLDRPFSVEVVALEDVLDVCIDNQRTLINRRTKGEGDRLFFYCHCGGVTFESISVRPILRGRRREQA